MRGSGLITVAAGVALLALAGCRGERPAARPDSVDTAAEEAAAEECIALPAADITSITGTSVRAVAAGSVAGADGDCGNYASPDGAMYVSVSTLASMADFTRVIGAVQPAEFPVRQSLTGLGDEAMLFSSDDSRARRLVVRKGERGVIIASFDESVTDDQLQQLASRAIDGRRE